MLDSLSHHEGGLGSAGSHRPQVRPVLALGREHALLPLTLPVPGAGLDPQRGGGSTRPAPLPEARQRPDL